MILVMRLLLRSHLANHIHSNPWKVCLFVDAVFCTLLFWFPAFFFVCQVSFIRHWIDHIRCWNGSPRAAVAFCQTTTKWLSPTATLCFSNHWSLVYLGLVEALVSVNAFWYYFVFFFIEFEYCNKVLAITFWARNGSLRTRVAIWNDFATVTVITSPWTISQRCTMSARHTTYWQEIYVALHRYGWTSPV